MRFKLTTFPEFIFVSIPYFGPEFEQVVVPYDHDGQAEAYCNKCHIIITKEVTFIDRWRLVFFGELNKPINTCTHALSLRYKSEKENKFLMLVSTRLFLTID